MTEKSKLSDLPDAVVQKGDELSQMLAEFTQKLDKEDKGDELLIPSVDHAAPKPAMFDHMQLVIQLVD